MIEEIVIKNLGIIKDASLTFGKGLTCITGETGAGKTMVLSALGLLLGRRSDSSIVHADASYTSVEGCFHVEGSNLVTKIVDDAGGVIEDSQLYVNRTVFNDGRSKASVGGKGTPASVLNAIGEVLISIHGQSDQVRLKSPAAQREALDDYNKEMMGPVINAYRDAYYAWKASHEELEDVKNNMFAREREFEELTQAVSDISKIEPESGEDEKLKNDADRLSNVEILKEATSSALSRLSSDDYDSLDASSLLSEAYKILDNVSSYDTFVLKLAEKTESIKDELVELVGQLSGYLENIDVDALEELNNVQERRAQINTLMRKYGPTLDDVLKLYEEAVHKVDALNPENVNVDVLEAKVNDMFNIVKEKAAELTEARIKNANEITAKINAELAGLAMSGSSIIVNVEPSETYTSNGVDEVSFLMKSHSNSEPRPISKSASGGELSRIMLALELVIADPEATSTFVFDEVDSGVGGATAIEIGKRLSQLSKHAQVIVVTHLPQVAVFADNHLRVVKTSDETFVSTDVLSLEEEDKVDEIARMLSGLQDSETGQAHAKEMILIAEDFKASL